MRPEDVVARQHGIVSRAQAVACGMSARTVRRRVLSGAWREVVPGVHLVGGYAFDGHARVVAASIWGGSSATVSHLSAAFWFGLLDRPGAPVFLTMPRRTHRGSVDSVRVRLRDLEAVDRTVRRGVAVTALPLTVLETAAMLPNGHSVVDRALQQHLVTFADLHEAYCRGAGAHGMRNAGALLAAAGAGADSAVERRLLTALRRAGVTGLVPRYPFGDRWIDIALPDALVAIEVDSWAWHTDPERFAADRAKGNALVAAGWTVLRFTWHDVTHRLPEVVSRVRAAARQ